MISSLLFLATRLDELKRCEWSFGDGATETTSGTRARHSYAKRPQDAESSSYLVTAWVTDSRKRHAWARATVTLWNRYFQSRKYTGDRPLPVAYDRFLQPGARFPVKIRNIESRPVVFENAVVTPKSCRNGEAMQATAHGYPAAEIDGRAHEVEHRREEPILDKDVAQRMIGCVSAA